MSDQTPLTREELSRRFQWDNYPMPLQDRLFAHYEQFQHVDHPDFRLLDIQSATDALYWVVLGSSVGRFVEEHQRYFGETSANDIISMAQALKQLRQRAS